jgi:hypothetical protein
MKVTPFWRISEAAENFWNGHSNVPFFWDVDRRVKLVQARNTAPEQRLPIPYSIETVFMPSE